MGTKPPFRVRSEPQVHRNRPAAAVHSEFLEQVPDVELDRVQRSALVTSNLLVGTLGRKVGQRYGPTVAAAGGRTNSPRLWKVFHQSDVETMLQTASDKNGA